MINHKLYIAGATLDLGLPAAEITAAINEALAPCYPGGIVTADYCEVDPRTAMVTFHRELPYDHYGVYNGCLGYIDESIISGIIESAFVLSPDNKQKPVISPLLPWGRFIWYSPKAIFGNLFRKINEIKVSEKLSRVRFNAGPESVEVIVKYPRPQNKYIDDIEDLEAEIGPLAGHKGETLTYTLKQLADIVEREHVKKKSYMGLISYLRKTYDITLEITS